MTSLPPPSFTATVEAGTGTAHLHLSGELDYETGDELVRQAEEFLDAHPDLRDLRLDCSALPFCDSTGLSALLMVHRLTTARAMALHLDHPPAFLERMLATTGVRGLFPSASARAAQRAEQPPGNQ